MIELQNLTKSYVLRNGERRYIFRDLSFHFPDGVNVGLIGRNGAGKSTLLRLIGGIDVPDSGRVVTDQRISWPVGLSGGFHRMLSGRDSVKFACRIYGAEGEDMREKVRFVQEFAELGEYFDQPISSYSSGMRTRLGFGMSMAFDFDYYLIDEVMAVGDARFKMKSRALMQERLDRSHVIMVSHGMEDISRLCNVVVLVQDGQAILYEDVREGIKAYQATGGRVPRRQDRPGRNRPLQGAAKGVRQGREGDAPAREAKRKNGANGLRGPNGKGSRKKTTETDMNSQDAE
ncbi:MAG: ABC transporter ATP-binding protein [Thiobacillus sp.]|nr:ABC transporter ATP-binding protein [Thiobacillus sp.]